jgi:hypothetical protein
MAQQGEKIKTSAVGEMLSHDADIGLDLDLGF